MSGPGPSPYPPVASPVRTRVDLSMNALTSSPSTSSPSAPPRQSSPRTIAAPTYPYLQNTYPPVQQQQHQLPSIQYPPSLAAPPLHDLRPNYHQYGQDSAGGGLPPLSAATTHHVPQQHQHHQMSAGGSPYQQQQQFHYPPTGMFTPPTTTTAPYSPVCR